MEEIPYQIKYRPGTQNQLPDYLSRKTGLEVDEGVNCEDPFENKIYHVEGPGDRMRKIRAEQGKDYVVREAIRQIGEQGQVWRGQFRKVATFLSVKEGTLYFDTRIVAPKTLQFDTVQRVHSEVHFGQARTLQLVRRSYFWIGLTRDVKTQCRTCKVCQKAKPSRKPKEPLGSVDYGYAQPGEAVGMDIGTLPWADGDHRYFLLMVDLFSHYVEAVPLKDQTAKSVVKAFLQGWVYRGHGVPRVVLTDQGKNVDGLAVHELCHDLGIDKRHTTPYHPEADGMAERHIGFVKQTIRCLMLERDLEKGSWPSLLPEATFYCNNLDNASSKVSPHMLAFGRQPRAPIDMLITADNSDPPNSQYLQRLVEKKEELIEIARSNHGDSRRVAKKNYDKSKKTSDSDITRGDWVLIKKEQRTDSLDVKFEGPFEVLERRGVIIQVAGSRSEKWIHLNRCRKYEGASPVIAYPRETEEQVMEEEEVTPKTEISAGIAESAVREEDTTEVPEDVEDREANARRYPRRDRKRKIYQDFVDWDQVPTGWWRK